MKEETVSSFIVEQEVMDYAEEVTAVGDNGLNIGQEVFIDSDQVTYEVMAASTIEEVIGLEDGVTSEDITTSPVEVVSHQPDMVTSSGQAAKKNFKKRRGRPPTFQVSEIGLDGRKYYSCTVCNERYEDRMDLMQHMRSHNAERPFHCRDCGRAFKQAAHLKVHERQHTGEKPFECGICGKGFRQKAIVDQHMRTHTQLRPYACTVPNCDKSFAQKTSLDNHTKSHTQGRLSEAFKRNQEEQRKKSLIAQETLKNAKTQKQVKTVAVRTKKQKAGTAAGPVTSSQVVSSRGGPTVIKLTQAQFEQYIKKQRAGSTLVPLITKVRPPALVNGVCSTPGGNMVMNGVGSSQAVGSNATGPFLSYVNIHKPILQSERPDLSLLEVLKELASRWNSMDKLDKAKFSAPKETVTAAAAVSDDTEECEADAGHSIAGAVFEVEAASELDTVETPELTLTNSSDKSLNQNVFGKRVVLVSEGKPVRFSAEERLEVVTSLDTDPLPSAFSSLQQFDDKGTIIFDPTQESGSDLENAIFYLPNIVEEGTLEGGM